MGYFANFEYETFSQLLDGELPVHYILNWLASTERSFCMILNVWFCVGMKNKLPQIDA